MRQLISIVLILFFLQSCQKKVDDYNFKGFVVGFDPCSYATNQIGYVLVSSNLSDTLITYNFPDSLFYFPESLFSNYLNSGYFPSLKRYEYKVKMNYKMAKDDELVYLLCPGYLNESEFNHAKQVITLTASEY